MPPKQNRKLTVENKKGLDDRIQQFLELHNSEVEKRVELMYKEADRTYFTIRDGIVKAAEKLLPEDVLNANLFDFLRTTSSAKDSKDCAEEISALKDVSLEDLEIDITSRDDGASENLSIPVQEDSTRTGIMEHMQTPLQEKIDISNLPSTIHPKADKVRKHRFRAARNNEVAFSVDGSPIVILPENRNDPESLVLKQIMEGDEKAFSPNSRELVTNFKNFLRETVAKKAAALSQELD